MLLDNYVDIDVNVVKRLFNITLPCIIVGTDTNAERCCFALEHRY